MAYADKAKKRRWECENKERIRASQRRYNLRNAATIKAKAREQYASDPDKLSRWARENPDKMLQSRLRNGAQTRARALGVPFNLKISDIVVPDTCPVFGLKLEKNKDRQRDNSPTLDRTVPELGYVVGNVKVISYKANCIKSFGTAEEHRAVANYMDAL